MIEKLYPYLIAFSVLVFSFFSTAGAQSADDAYRTELFSSSQSPEVEISTSGGSINVIGHDRREVVVEMYARRGNRYLTPSDTDLSDYEISIEKNGDYVLASARREDGTWNRLFGSNRNISISFRVYVPHAALVDGRTSGGSVSAEQMTNRVSLKTSGGSVSAENISGTADFRTSGGSISIENADGEISARTSGGSIRVNGLRGEAELSTSGGSVRLENIDAKMSAKTSGGGIEAHFLTFNDDINLRTSGGSIRIDIPESENYDLNLKGQRVRTNLRNFTGQAERDLITGRVGSGGPELSARTSGGSVRLEYH